MMQNPYDRYQKSQGVKGEGSSRKKKKVKPQAKKGQRRSPQKPSPKPGLNLGLVFASFIGLALSFYIFAYTDQFMAQVNRIQLGISKSMAEDSAASDDKKSAKDAPLPVGKVSHLRSDGDHLTMENASVYKALQDKSRELEKKERRLAQLEEDLQKEKAEIEKQLNEMKEIRRNISSKLDKKVAADQESVDKLVGVYSNMKPQNAALILSQIDEELAIKVMGKMKKQNAAAILNHVEPGKAQLLSEKFTGLKK